MTKLLPVAGVKLSAVSAGIYANDSKDLALFEFTETAVTSAVFTQNKFLAAPVILAKKHLGCTSPNYLLINAGNANAGTGKQGILDAEHICLALADIANTKTESVLPFSTGVIGEYLPKEKILSKLAVLLQSLSDDGWQDCAEAIMTTDTCAKYCSHQVEIDGELITITGIAKGSGMIKPDMATMLAFITTDAVVEAESLDEILQRSVARSFNKICVDGDTSTNDACVLTATNQAANKIINSSHPQLDVFEQAIQTVCLHLAKSIVKDAEGATKFVTIDIQSGQSEKECSDLAFLLATSPLVKTALYASDPNWGRILAVVGRADIQDLNIDAIRIFLNDLCIVENGGRSEDYVEAKAQLIMQDDEILIEIQLGRGTSNCQVWTCDLSHDYVTINAEYRT